jgi:hypothetical protein
MRPHRLVPALSASAQISYFNGNIESGSKRLGRAEGFCMTNNEDQKASARRKAQNHFTSSEQRDAALRKELETQRAASAAKTARLRALRLAKEAEDKAEADKRAAEQSALPPKAQRVRRTVRRITGS